MKRRTSNRPLKTRIGLVGLALIVLAGTFYIPLPVVITKDLSVAFPCMGMGCGCRDADQCWDSCCCHSDAEKMAWARENEVRPPKWFLDRWHHSSQSTTADADSIAEKSSCCCSKKQLVTKAPARYGAGQGSCCSTKLVPKATLAPSCCDSDGVCNSETLVQDESDTSNASGLAGESEVYLCLRQQRNCQGQGDDCLHLKVFFVPERAIAFSTDAACYALPVSSSVPIAFGIAPPVPPG